MPALKKRKINEVIPSYESLGGGVVVSGLPERILRLNSVE
jgi:hypothetical protein